LLLSWLQGKQIIETYLKDVPWYIGSTAAIDYNMRPSQVSIQSFSCRLLVIFTNEKFKADHTCLHAEPSPSDTGENAIRPPRLEDLLDQHVECLLT